MEKTRKIILLSTACFFAAGYLQAAQEFPDHDWSHEATAWRISIAEKDVRCRMSEETLDDTRALVLGVTGSGKSTLIHGLAGKNLVIRRKGFNLVIEPTSDAEALPGFKIGHGYISATSTPYSWRDESNGLVYWDCPGFADSGGAGQDIVNAFAIDQLFTHPSKIKIMLVVSAAEFEVQRGAAAFERFKKLTEIMPNRLTDALSLVISRAEKREGSFDHYHSNLVGAANDIETNPDRASNLLSVLPLIKFFAQSKRNIFYFPKAEQEGSYELFRDRERLIAHLQYTPVINPDHAVSLDGSAKLVIYDIMKKLGEVNIFIQDMFGFVQTEYRGKDVSAMREWLHCFNSLNQSVSVFDSPEKFVAAFKSKIPVATDTSLIDPVLEKILTNQKFFTFLGKVTQQGGWRAEDIPNVFEKSRPFLENCIRDLHSLIEHKEYALRQEEELAETNRKLESEAASRRAEAEAAQNQINSIKEKAEEDIRNLNHSLLQTQNETEQRKDEIKKLEEASNHMKEQHEAEARRLAEELEAGRIEQAQMNASMSKLSEESKAQQEKLAATQSAYEEKQQALVIQQEELLKTNREAHEKVAAMTKSLSDSQKAMEKALKDQKEAAEETRLKIEQDARDREERIRRQLESAQEAAEADKKRFDERIEEAAEAARKKVLDEAKTASQSGAKVRGTVVRPTGRMKPAWVNGQMVLVEEMEVVTEGSC